MFNNPKSILVTQKSVKKKLKPSECKRFQKHRLPFSIPLKKPNSDEIVWPLKSLKGFIYFNSMLNAEEKCVDVPDSCSTQAIYHFGFFGKGSLSSNAPIYDLIKNTLISIPNSSSPSSDNKSLPFNYLHINSFTKAFGSLRESHILVNELYEHQSPLRSNERQASQSEEIEYPFNQEDQNGSEPDTDHEILKLGFEEAFFLSYGLGVLNIYDPSSNCYLNLDQIWNTFCTLYNQNDITAFPVLYAAYHFFRSKGWVVKSGIKFGCNLLLYKEGPPYYHSLLSVTVIKHSQKDQVNSQLTWPYALSLNRVTQGVSKKVILCYVIIPDFLTAEQFKSPKVIQEFEVQTLLMERWNPSHNRKDGLE